MGNSDPVEMFKDITRSFYNSQRITNRDGKKAETLRQRDRQRDKHRHTNSEERDRETECQTLRRSQTQRQTGRLINTQRLPLMISHKNGLNSKPQSRPFRNANGGRTRKVTVWHRPDAATKPLGK